MEKIEIPKVCESGMNPGIYVSRKVSIDGDILTCFELQLTHKESEPPLTPGEIHVIDCIFGGYLRKHSKWKDKAIYFGSNENDSGFNLIFKGDLKVEDVVDLLREGADYILGFNKEIPACKAIKNDVAGAKFYIKKYKIDVLDSPNLK